MKGLFRKFKLKKKKPRIIPGKSVAPPLPFAVPKSGGKKKRSSTSRDENNNTRIGGQPEKPFAEHPTISSQGDSLACPKCKYPLRVQPTMSSPCPNCGFSGDQHEPGDTAYDRGKTMPLSGLDLSSGSEVDSLQFKLIEESSNSEIKIQSEESEVVLNRNHIDPDNKSISSEQHILVKFRDNRLFLEDVSSNGATFMQVKNMLKLQPGSRLVLGNKVFVFDLPDNTAKDTATDNATRKFGDFDLQGQEANGFNLIDEKRGKTIGFNEQNVIVNRSNLDPGNNTISGSKHAEFSFKNGSWYIEDLSSTGATFIQVKTEYQLEKNTKLIIGNAIFRFDYDT